MWWLTKYLVFDTGPGIWYLKIAEKFTAFVADWLLTRHLVLTMYLVFGTSGIICFILSLYLIFDKISKVDI